MNSIVYTTAPYNSFNNQNCQESKGFQQGLSYLWGKNAPRVLYTTHRSWASKLSYDPWVMGEKIVVRPMGHGPANCRTTHGSWVTKVSYDPWVMGQKIVVRPMGHGPPKCRTTHGSWASNSIVRHRMAHGSWAIVMSYGPWVMGKKSLKGLLCFSRWAKTYLIKPK